MLRNKFWNTVGYVTKEDHIDDSYFYVKMCIYKKDTKVIVT